MASPDQFLIYENILQCVTLSGVAKNEGRHPTEKDLNIIENAAIVVDQESNRITWVGETKALPKEFKDCPNVYSENNEIWFPELVECHTHFLFAGNRFKDYARRCAGKTYQDIAAEGGGILSTLKHTREASAEELIQHGQQELERFQRYGIGTIECKTGYGLSLESELKLLQCLRILQSQASVYLVTTFMPAHATPPEFKGRTDEFVDAIATEWLPEVGREDLANFFDIFVEEGFFTTKHLEKLAPIARDHGMKLKIHADQFTDQGATALGLEMGAVSIDHLDHISKENISRFGESKTVAVLLPGASLFTGTPYPPARELIDAGARVALSTDYNPGTCPSRNLPLMTTLACSQMKMTVPESIAAITYNAAAALGIEKELGSIEPGKLFRVCQLKAQSYEALPYSFGELE